MSAPAIVLKRIGLDKLQADPKNARKHPEKSIEAIKKSLLAYGQQKPVVVTKAGLIVAGHGMVAAADELGWTEIDVAVTNLKDADIKGFAVADNRVAEMSEWDMGNLGEVLHELRELDYDIGDTGFELDDFEAMFAPKPKAPKAKLAPAAPPPAQPDEPETRQVSFTATVGGEGRGDNVIQMPEGSPREVILSLSAHEYEAFKELSTFLCATRQQPSVSGLFMDLMREEYAALSPDSE